MAAQFTTLYSKVVPLLVNNIDTDQIIPARFLKGIDKQGLGSKLFADWRYTPNGKPKSDFALNRPEHTGAAILLAGDNFGCGSSREHAPWALVGHGIRAVISTSFADIFRNNALKNGLVPVIVSPALHARLAKLVQDQPDVELKVDLVSATLSLPDGTSTSFPVDSFAQHCLINGIDELEYILSFEQRIQRHEAQRS